MIKRFCILYRAILRDYPENVTKPHELVSLRQELSRLYAGLFDAYMATRKVQHR
jgi:hypothetical protein